MSAAEQALKVWTYAQRAAIGLSMLEPELSTQWPRVMLGSSLSDELVRELGHLAGTVNVYRYRGDDSIEWVRYAFEAEVGRVTVEGWGQRPATDADAKLPLRGGR